MNIIQWLNSKSQENPAGEGVRRCLIQGAAHSRVRKSGLLLDAHKPPHGHPASPYRLSAPALTTSVMTTSAELAWVY